MCAMWFFRHELALILNSVSHSAQYLEAMFAELNDHIFNNDDKSQDDPSVMGMVQEFTKACQQAGDMARTKSDQFVMFFCQEQGRIMDKWGSNPFLKQACKQYLQLSVFNRFVWLGQVFFKVVF